MTALERNFITSNKFVGAHMPLLSTYSDLAQMHQETFSAMVIAMCAVITNTGGRKRIPNVYQ
jgi:hypothetical protein